MGVAPICSTFKGGAKRWSNVEQTARLHPLLHHHPLRGCGGWWSGAVARVCSTLPCPKVGQTATRAEKHKIMLERTNPPRDRHARFRQRQRDGKAVAAVEFDGEVLSWLIRLGWLLEADAVGKAIGAMIAASARR